MKIIKFFLFIFLIFGAFLAVERVFASTCCGPGNKSYCVKTCSGRIDEGTSCPSTIPVCCALEGTDCSHPSIYEQIPEGAANADFQKMLKEKIGEEDVGVLKKGAAALNPMNIGEPADLLARAINALLAFMGSIALVLYIYAGFIWMSASGNTEKVTKAKAILIWTTLGIAAMGASYMVISTILKRIG